MGLRPVPWPHPETLPQSRLQLQERERGEVSCQSVSAGTIGQCKGTRNWSHGYDRNYISAMVWCMGPRHTYPGLTLRPCLGLGGLGSRLQLKSVLPVYQCSLEGLQDSARGLENGLLGRTEIIPQQGKAVL
eukprot:TRINITY_DN11015_c0_g1_i1.p1 TRINITY_DN11015_c0_g1~~TRINITY_DN11015_c0_g1_i1.p1  ORF type:complete len:131 (+),score=15.91 TRINITY_DN11015_c0_g1_i1:74-466(+)